MKKYLFTALLVAILATVLSLTALAADGTADVTLDGKALKTPAQFGVSGTELPVRDVLEALGYTVAWNTDSNGGDAFVSAHTSEDSIVLYLTRQTALDNGHTFAATGDGLVLQGGRTFIDADLLEKLVPVRVTVSEDKKSVAVKSYKENSMNVTAVTIYADTKYLQTNIQYPNFDGLSEPVQSAVNSVLKAEALSAQAEGLKNAADMAEAISGGFTGAVGQCQTYFDYQIAFNRDGLLSVMLTDYQFAGGANGTTVQRAYTFNLSTGQQLALADLGGDQDDFKFDINTAVRKEIDRRVAAGELDELSDSPFKDIGDTPEFYLSDEGIVVFFQEVTYFPHYAGIQEFTVPYTQLSGLLNSTYSFLASGG